MLYVIFFVFSYFHLHRKTLISSFEVTCEFVKGIHIEAGTGNQPVNQLIRKMENNMINLL